MRLRRQKPRPHDPFNNYPQPDTFMTKYEVLTVASKWRIPPGRNWRHPHRPDTTPGIEWQLGDYIEVQGKLRKIIAIMPHGNGAFGPVRESPYTTILDLWLERW